MALFVNNKQVVWAEIQWNSWRFAVTKSCHHWPNFFLNANCPIDVTLTVVESTCTDENEFLNFSNCDNYSNEVEMVRTWTFAVTLTWMQRMLSVTIGLITTIYYWQRQSITVMVKLMTVIKLHSQVQFLFSVQKLDISICYWNIFHKLNHKWSIVIKLSCHHGSLVDTVTCCIFCSSIAFVFLGSVQTSFQNLASCLVLFTD